MMISRFLKRVNLIADNRALLLKSVLCFVLSAFLLSILVSQSISWYLGNQNVENDMTNLNSAGFGDAYQVGHDSYKYDLDQGKGIAIEDEIVTMNRYDKVFSSRNQSTPIILRAVLSPDWEEKAQNNQVKIKVSCGSDSLFRDGYDKNGDGIRDTAANGKPVTTPEDMKRDEEGRLDGSGRTDGIIDYLSNIVNFRASYIPNLADTAESGSYMPLANGFSAYSDKNDYIYQYAVDYFKENSHSSVDFWKRTSNTTPGSTETTKRVSYRVTKLTNVSEITSDASQGSNNTTTENGNTIITTVEYDAPEYLISYNDTFLGLNNTTIVGYSFGITPKSYTNEEWTSFTNVDRYLWTMSGGSTTLKNTNGNYLRYNNGLNGSTTATTWTISSNSDKFLLSTASGWRSYYLRYNNGSWSATTASPGANLTVYKVEKCTTTTSTTTPPVTVDTSTKTFSIDVNLNQARADNGYFYVYIMIDYDKTDINDYIKKNGLSWSIGSDGDIDLEDYFNITVEDI